MPQTLSQVIYHECDFCKIQGVLDKNIFNREGWYFCKSCLAEIDHELEIRRRESQNRNG